MRRMVVRLRIGVLRCTHHGSDGVRWCVDAPKAQRKPAPSAIEERCTLCGCKNADKANGKSTQRRHCEVCCTLGLAHGADAAAGEDVVGRVAPAGVQQTEVAVEAAFLDPRA